MTPNIRTNRKLFTLSILLLGSLVLAACGGSADQNGSVAAGQASVEVQSEQDSSAAAEGDTGSSESSEASAGSENDQSADAEADSADAAEADGEEQASARVVPQIEMGSPQLKASAAGVFDRYAEGVKVLEFFAFWCPSCKALAPSIHGLEAAYAGEVDFTFLDIDDPANQELKNEYSFAYQPYVLVIDGEGSIQRVWVGGGIDVYEIQAELERLLEAQG